jgi:hypothetical protein
MRRDRVRRVQELLRDSRTLRPEPLIHITGEGSEEPQPEQTTELASLTGRFATAVITYGQILGLDNPPKLDIEPYTIRSDAEAA